MNKRVIGFCGSHCTGKTTLAKLVAERYTEHIELCVEGVREAAAELGIPDVRSIKPKQRQRFQERVLERHLDALFAFRRSDKGLLICDRTVYDIWAYTDLAWGRGEPIKSSFVNLLSQQCRHPYYDRVIYFDLIEVPVHEADDGFRDMTGREEIASLIQKSLRSKQVPFLRISDGRQDRQEFMDWLIGRLISE